MHTHFDDRSWQAAASRYKASVALPEALITPGLDDTRARLNDDAASEPSVAGLSFEEILQQAGAKTDFRSVTDDEQAKDASSLAHAIKQGKWSVEEVIEAYLAKAALAQQVLGCFTEIHFDRARQRAKELDTLLASTSNRQTLGRLFGVPISIKAHLSWEGSGSDRGFVFDVLDPDAMERLLDEEERKGSVERSTIALLRKQGAHRNASNAHMIDMLLNEGAVILGKTTMPQSIMHLDTRSNLHGQTLNPHNVHLSPGGSSGGEAASVACGATLAGVGTDIGGSVRQPAACVGLFGLRPTIGRLSVAGTRSTMLGNEGILGTAGPFARSLADLELMTSVLTKRATESDPFLCPPLPWRGAQRPTKLRVGVMLHDGFVQPITPIRRALQHAVNRLRANEKVEIIPVDPQDFGKRAWQLARELYFMDNGQLIGTLARLTGEPLTRLTDYILRTPPVQDHSAADSWLLQYTREQFKREFWRSVFAERKLDVLLCPASALVAPRPQQILYWGYTSLFNVTDLPGVTFPVAGFEANAQKDKAFEAELGGSRNDSFSDLDEKVKEEYEGHRDVFDRAPVGLQLIGHRFREEELLGALSLLMPMINA